MQVILLGACAIGIVLFIISQIFGGSNGIPSGTPPVVIVTVLDPDSYSKEYIDNVKDNRIEYARKHGRYTFKRSSNIISNCPQVTALFSQTLPPTNLMMRQNLGRESLQSDMH